MDADICLLQTSLKIGDVIGAGQYGIVYQCHYNARMAAIKKFRLRQYMTDQIKIIQQEITLLQRLQDRHIIQFYGVFRQGNEISLITDFAEGGSLNQAIEDSRVPDWHIKKRIAQEIAYGLAYIHHEGVIHRDLKSDNVLLTRHMEVKLCDFGLAVTKKASGSHTTEVMRGTVRWLAPELLRAAKPSYTNKADIYALGMVMWEMAAMCTLPFKTIDNNFVVAQAVHGGEREKLPDNTPPDYRRWVELCWKQDSSDRPQAREVILVSDASSRRLSTSEVASSTDAPLTLSLAVTPAATVDVPLPDTSLKAPLPVPSLSEEPRAMRCVGDMYAAGRCAEQNDNEATRWHKKASSHGKSDSQSSRDGTQPELISLLPDTSRYGLELLKSVIALVTNVSFTKGVGAKADVKQQAAEKGDAAAQSALGLMYANGQDVEQSDIEAIKWFTKSASQGDPDGQLSLGWMYANGRGVEQSDVEAVKWFTKAASQGDPHGQINLGNMYKNGRGVEQSDVEAVKWYTKAASQGDPHGQNSLGNMYKNGRGVKQSDVEAAKWYTKAASQGNPDGQNSLGLMYLNGRGVEQGDVEAAKLFTEAASQGNPHGQFILGVMYENGRGVEQSDVEAAKWYTKAASQGNPSGQNSLGFMYLNGRGVEQSDVEAVK
ncbi:hypothetical protein DFQ26_007938, partial [Actinomortierella ambigua]